MANDLCSVDSNPEVKKMIEALNDSSGKGGKGKWELARTLNGGKDPVSLDQVRDLLLDYYNLPPISSYDDLLPDTPTVGQEKKELSKFDQNTWDHFDVPIKDRMAELRNLEHRVLRTKSGLTNVISDWRKQFQETKEALGWEHKEGENIAHGTGMGSSHKGRYNPDDQGKKTYQTEGGDLIHGILERLREVKHGDRKSISNQIHSILHETLPYVHNHGFEHLAGILRGEDGKIKGEDEFVEALTDIVEQFEILDTEVKIKHGAYKKSAALTGVIDAFYRHRENGDVLTVDYKTSGVKDSLDGGNFGRMKSPTQYGETPYEHVQLQTLKYATVFNKGMRDKGFKGDFTNKRAIFPINLEFQPYKDEKGNVVKGKYVLSGIKSAIIPHADNLFKQGSKAHMYELPNTADFMKRANSELNILGIAEKEPLSRAALIESRISALSHQIANLGNALRRAGRKEMANRVLAETGAFEAEGSLGKQLSGAFIFVRDAYRLLDAGVHMDRNQLNILNDGINDIKNLLEEFGEQSLPSGIKSPIDDYVHTVLGIHADEPLGKNLAQTYEDNINYLRSVVLDGLAPKLEAVANEYADRNFVPEASDIIWRRHYSRKIKQLATNEAQRQLKTDKHTKEVKQLSKEIMDEWMGKPEQVEIYKSNADELAKIALGMYGKKLVTHHPFLIKTWRKISGYFTILSDQQGFTNPIDPDLTQGTDPYEELATTNPDKLIDDYVVRKLAHTIDKVRDGKEKWKNEIVPLATEIIKMRKKRPYEFKVDDPYGFMKETVKRTIRIGKENVEVDYPVITEKYKWYEFNEEEDKALREIEEQFPIRSYDMPHVIDQQKAKQKQALAQWRKEHMVLAPEFGGDEKKAANHVKKSLLEKLEKLRKSGFVSKSKVLDRIIKNVEGSENVLKDFEKGRLLFNRGNIALIDTVKDRAGNIIKEHSVDVSQTTEGDLASNMFFDSSREAYVPRDEKYQSEVYRSLEALPESHVYRKFYKKFRDFIKFHDYIVPPEKRQHNNVPRLLATGVDPSKQRIWQVDPQHEEYTRRLNKEGGAIWNIGKMGSAPYMKKWFGVIKDVPLTDHDSRALIPLSYSGTPTAEPKNLSWDLGAGLYAMASNLEEYIHMVPAAADIEIFMNKAKKSRSVINKKTGTLTTVPNPEYDAVRDMIDRVVYKEKDPGKAVKIFDNAMSYFSLTAMMFDAPMQLASHFTSFMDVWIKYGGRELKNWEHAKANLSNISLGYGFVKVIGADRKEHTRLLKRHKALAKFMGMDTLSSQYAINLPKNIWDQFYTDVNTVLKYPSKWINAAWGQAQDKLIKLGMALFSIQDSTIKGTVAETLLRSVDVFNENKERVGSVFDILKWGKDGSVSLPEGKFYTNVDDLRDEYKQEPVLNDKGEHIKNDKGDYVYELKPTGRKTGGVPLDLTDLRKLSQKMVSITTTQTSPLDRAPYIKEQVGKITVAIKDNND